MTKIEFTDTDDSNSYTPPYNPVEWDAIDNVDYKLQSTLDGVPVRGVATFDDRVRRMVWPANEHTNSVFTTMVSTLKSYKGLEKKLNCHDIDTMSRGNKTIKIINVTTNLRRGGKLKYDLVLEYNYVDSI